MLLRNPISCVADASCGWLVGGNVPLAVLQPLLDQRTKGGNCHSIESVHGGRCHGRRRNTRFAPVGWHQTASRATT